MSTISSPLSEFGDDIETDDELASAGEDSAPASTSSSIPLGHSPTNI